MKILHATVIGGGLCLAAAGTPAAAEGQAGFTTVKFFIEYNATDRDVGVQVFLGGDPWKDLEIHRPDGGEILDVEAEASLEQQGISEFFFESAEPSLDQVSLEEFLARFPEGGYRFEGETLRGRDVAAEARFHHAIPGGPVIVAPDPSGPEPPVVDPAAAVIEWKPAPQSVRGSPQVVGYQVTVEQEEPPRIFRIDVPASVTRVTVPPEFFAQRGTEHGFEVLAIEAGGNQTISAGEFVTAP